jgi:uncharacterized protein YdeI (YjbR/CyaY-like superfamily)
MGTKDPRIDAYIAKSADFAKPILKHIRTQVHTHCPDATETLKWSMPHFEYGGGILCHMASFKQHCGFGFWLGSLLKIDARSDDAMGQFGRITSLADLPGDAKFAQLIKQAMKLQDAGAKVPERAKPVEKKELVIPPAFLAAVKKNKKALATFEAFPYSKKKEYVEWFTEAKTDATREKRLAQAIEWMAEGKSRNWKYQNC